MTICFEGYFRTVMCTQQINNKDQRKSIKVGHFLLQTTSSSVLFVAVLFILTTMAKYSLNSCGKLNF